MMERVYTHGVAQCVQGATHFWPGQVPGGLDHIYTSVHEKLSQVKVKVCGSSDHRLIITTRHAKNIVENARYCRKRSYKNFDERKFMEELDKVKWWGVYSCNDVDVAVDIFTGILTDILDIMAPIKTFQLRTKYATWVSKGTLQKIKSRNEAQQVASQTGLQADWEAYKKLRNQVTSLLRRDKQVWHQSKLASCEEINDSAKLWKNILGWLNWSSTSSPTKLLNEGNLETSPKKLAEIQNKFYIEKVKKIRAELQEVNKDPLDVRRERLEGNQAVIYMSGSISMSGRQDHKPAKELQSLWARQY